MNKCFYCNREVEHKEDYDYCNKTCESKHKGVEESALLKYCPPLKFRGMTDKEIKLQQEWLKKIK